TDSHCTFTWLLAVPVFVILRVFETLWQNVQLNCHKVSRTPRFTKKFIMSSGIWNLRLNQFHEFIKGFLPAEIAHLCRYCIWNSILLNFDFSTGDCITQ